MPAAETVLLPLCVALAIVGVVITGFAWRRGNKGRVIQGIGLVFAPVALYFTGLLRLVWDAVVAVVGWAARLAFSPTVWFGLGLLALCVLLWVVGGLLARRSSGRAKPAKQKQRQVPGATGAHSTRQVGAGRAAAGKKQPQQAEVDPEMAEIEALLKSRGID